MGCFRVLDREYCKELGVDEAEALFSAVRDLEILWGLLM
jgi:hypothetical protein